MGKWYWMLHYLPRRGLADPSALSSLCISYPPLTNQRQMANFTRSRNGPVSKPRAPASIAYLL